MNQKKVVLSILKAMPCNALARSMEIRPDFRVRLLTIAESMHCCNDLTACCADKLNAKGIASIATADAIILFTFIIFIRLLVYLFLICARVCVHIYGNKSP